MAKAGTKARSDEGTKEDAQAEGKVEETKTVKVEPLPACPKGMYRLRSRYRTYRFAGVQFHDHVAIVDEATYQKAQRSPQFGQGGGHFWLDTNQT